MTHRFRTRVALLTTVASIALTGTGAAAAGAYVPFVTDFPAGPAAEESYRPFATDFGIPPRPAGGGFTLEAETPVAAPVASGREWSDVALGGALGIALAALVGTAALAVWRIRGGRGGVVSRSA